MTRLRRIRLALALVMFGLFVSGVTAFPLLYELNLISDLLTGGTGVLDPASYTGLTAWVLTVREGLEATYRDYHFLAYGTDWLAFGHLMIMLYFVLPYRDPQRYIGVMEVGVWSSALVFPLAFVCGEIRGIPLFWRFVDCAFGVACMPLLVYAIVQTRRLSEPVGKTADGELENRAVT